MIKKKKEKNEKIAIKENDIKKNQRNKRIKC